MTKKSMIQAVLFFLFMISIQFSCVASTIVEDDVLIRPEFVGHFKEKYPQVSLAINIHNSFRSEERIKKRKVFAVAELPNQIDISTLKLIFPDLQQQLLELIGDKDPGNYEIIATISFEDSGNTDEVEGVKSLKVMKEEE